VKKAMPHNEANERNTSGIGMTAADNCCSPGFSVSICSVKLAIGDGLQFAKSK
jgi:hypothetical protein